MVDELVAAIKSKKELSGLDDSFVAERVVKIFNSDARIKRKYDNSKDFKQFSRSKEFDALLKTVRKELRTIYGVFQLGNAEELLGSYLKSRDPKLIDEMLECHTSTKERLPYYGIVYTKLSKLIGAPKKIFDLGCGLNPLSYPYMQAVGWSPYIVASDVSSGDMLFLATAFKELGIPGEAMPLDLVKEYEAVAEHSVDVVFLFKLLDSLEEASRHISYKLFDCLKSKWIVASFPTKSIGGKKNIATASRTWFERLLTRKELSWETFSVENELFYVIKNT